MRPLRLVVAGLVPAAIALVAFLNARAVCDLVAATVGGAPPLSDLVIGDVRAASAQAPARSAQAILDRNPFDHETGPLGQPEPGSGDGPALRDGDPRTAPLCEGVRPLVLVGHEDQSVAFASLEYRGKHLLRQRGGDVGDARVAYVGRDRLWLESRTGLCQALLFADPAAPPPPLTATPAVGARSALELEVEKKIVKTGANEFAIDRSTLERILEAQQELMKSRLVPEKVGEHVVGMRISGIKPGSVVAMLGLENGDRLETINGYEVSDPSKMLEAYARLRTGADMLNLHVVRGGKPLNLDYAIR